MGKKLPLGIVVGLLFLAVALSAVVTTGAVRARFNRILGDLPQKQTRYAVLDELDSIIAQNYYGKGDHAVMQYALENGVVSGLNDRYSEVLTAEAYAKYLEETNGEMRGIGITVSQTSSGTLRVDTVLDDSPAQMAGLAVGDVIVAIDATPLDASNADQQAAKLDNDKVSAVNLTYRRNRQEFSVQVEKGFEAVSVQTKTYHDIGYLKISDFYASTASQVQAAVDSFLASGVRALVLDVRENHSSNFENAISVLDVFVPVSSDAPAATMVNKAGKTIETFATTAGEVNLPMAVLVSGKTQAAAELFACNLRDFGKAQLVGTKTKGIALVRRLFNLSDGNALLLSVGEMLPMKSDSFNETGLSPDVNVTLEEATTKISNDSQFLAAVALFETQEGNG